MVDTLIINNFNLLCYVNFQINNIRLQADDFRTESYSTFPKTAILALPIPPQQLYIILYYFLIPCIERPLFIKGFKRTVENPMGCSNLTIFKQKCCINTHKIGKGYYIIYTYIYYPFGNNIGEIIII